MEDTNEGLAENDADGALNDVAIVELWQRHRRRMLDIAFRMLLDVGDAEDVVQEVFARLARTDLTALEEPEGWLVVVTSRLCLDRLRTRRRHPADTIDPADIRIDGLGSGAAAADPAERVTLDESVTLAMHSLLERLSPAERTSFVLHDVFQYSFDEVATIVGRSSAACRQLASRARRSVRADAPRTAASRQAVDLGELRLLSERFITACAGGDLADLLPLLDPDVSGRSDVFPALIVGAIEVGPGILRHLGPPLSPTMLHFPIGDRAGILAMRAHRVVALVILTIADDVVVHVDAYAGQHPCTALAAALGLTR